MYEILKRVQDDRVGIICKSDQFLLFIGILLIRQLSAWNLLAIEALFVLPQFFTHSELLGLGISVPGLY